MSEKPRPDFSVQEMMDDLVKDMAEESLRADEFTVNMYLDRHTARRAEALQEDHEEIPPEWDIKAARRHLNKLVKDGKLLKRQGVYCPDGRIRNAYRRNNA